MTNEYHYHSKGYCPSGLTHCPICNKRLYLIHLAKTKASREYETFDFCLNCYLVFYSKNKYERLLKGDEIEFLRDVNTKNFYEEIDKS